MDIDGINEAQVTQDWGIKLHNYYFQAKLLFKRFWWLILLCLSLGVLGSALRELNKDPNYVSVGQMIVSDRINVPEGDVYQEQFAYFFKTQIELMMSSKVLERARQRVSELHPELPDAEVSVHAWQKEDAAIFMLQANGTDPDYTQAYLDAVMEQYINFRKEMRLQTSETSLLAITEQLIRLEEKIEEEEQKQVDFQKENNVVFIKEQGKAAGSYLVRLNNQLTDLKTQLRLLETLGLDLQMDQSVIGLVDERIMESSVTETNKAYMETKANYEALVAKRDEFAIYLRPRHPKIISLNQEIERTKNLLSILEQQAKDSLTRRKSLLRKKIKNLEIVINEWEITALENSQRAAEYDRLTAQLERSRSAHSRLLNSLESIDRSQNLQQQTVTILENASPPLLIQASLPQKMFQGGIVGLSAAVGLLFLIAIIDARVVSADDLKKHFDAPVIGLIPEVELDEQHQISPLVAGDKRHLFAEACRSLRSSLLFMQTDTELPPQVLMVTSSIPGEGKSTIAHNLGIAIAFTASRVLLVDADLRRGQLAKRMNLNAEKGLSDYLQGDLTFDELLQPTGIDHLTFISTGKYPQRPGELLASARMDMFLLEAKKRYDYVIFDTAPILAADDSTGIGVRGDVVLFVVRSGYTQVRQVSSSVDRLRVRGAKVVGLILNAVDTKGTDYYYYKKYNEYYSN